MIVVLTGHPVMLQAANMWMFTHEGLGNRRAGVYPDGIPGTCMPMLNLTRRKVRILSDTTRQKMPAGDRPINLRCELLIPIRR